MALTVPSISAAVVVVVRTMHKQADLLTAVTVGQALLLLLIRTLFQF
jgi:hypothetical protein